ncbi:MAG: 3-oxoacyl-ACP reductase family protein [Candidatus Micrarchaeota archaeon]|nr:3-oxoacyl-ACP reductase family protein [Candidatus Micrarchaeota archaeon]
MKFQDKVALVTGSSRGIGKATALAFAHEGAKVVINYATNKKEAEKTLAEVKAFGVEAISIQCDVSNPTDVNRMFEETVKKFGRVDVLVNNAGIFHAADSLEKITLEDWDKNFKTNVIGTFLCIQSAAHIMKKQKSGKIVNISSVRGLLSCGRTPEYAASKAAVNSLTTTMAKELAPLINVNAVAPGWVETEMNSDIPSDLRKSETEKTYLKRFAKPEEIASAVLYLASDEATYITGQVLVVDGGYSLK